MCLFPILLEEDVALGDGGGFFETELGAKCFDFIWGTFELKKSTELEFIDCNIEAVKIVARAGLFNNGDFVETDRV